MQYMGAPHCYDVELMQGSGTSPQGLTFRRAIGAPLQPERVEKKSGC